MKFDVILADPAWPYRDESMSRGGAERHYKTMSIADICALQVQDIAAKNCALLMWATWPTLPDALAVISAWGFTYKTCAFLWVKTTIDGSKDAIGMGHYTRANSEPCLLATRGRVPVSDRGVRQIIRTPRKKHSEKPIEQYGLIERLYPDANYAELFARNTCKGWHSFGNEIDGKCLSESLRAAGGKDGAA